ncbi:MAG: hypothetical protein Tsb0020_12580 [Haliangiales bacterium]
MSGPNDIENARNATAQGGDGGAYDEHLLIDLLYGELEGDDLARAERRVREDDALSGELEALSELRALMSELPEEEPATAITNQLLHAANSEAAALKSAQSGGLLAGIWAWLQQLSESLARHPGLAAAASLVLVGGVAGALYLGGRAELAAPSSSAPMFEAANKAAEPAPAATATMAPEAAAQGAADESATERELTDEPDQAAAAGDGRGYDTGAEAQLQRQQLRQAEGGEGGALDGLLETGRRGNALEDSKMTGGLSAPADRADSSAEKSPRRASKRSRAPASKPLSKDAYRDSAGPSGFGNSQTRAGSDNQRENRRIGGASSGGGGSLSGGAPGRGGAAKADPASPPPPPAATPSKKRKARAAPKQEATPEPKLARPSADAPSREQRKADKLAPEADAADAESDDDLDAPEREEVAAEQPAESQEDSQASRSERVRGLHRDAIKAAKRRDCDAVRTLGATIRRLDLGYYRNQFTSDSSVRECLSQSKRSRQQRK